eukprot:5252033-Amphidinium_carterae.1
MGMWPALQTLLVAGATQTELDCLIEMNGVGHVALLFPHLERHTFDMCSPQEAYTMVIGEMKRRNDPREEKHIVLRLLPEEKMSRLNKLHESKPGVQTSGDYVIISPLPVWWKMCTLVYGASTFRLSLGPAVQGSVRRCEV